MIKIIKGLLILYVSLFTEFAFAQINLDSALIGYFKLDGNATDGSQLAIDGTASNTIIVAGKNNVANSAFEFNGVDSKIDCGISDRGVTNVVTISAWVKTTSTNLEFIVCKYDWRINRGYHLAMVNGHPILAGRNTSGVYTTTNYANPSNLIDDGNWHYLLGEISGNQWTLWVDCVLDNSVTSTAVNPDLANLEPLGIGYYPLGSSTGDHGNFDGVIDDVRIYNRQINTSERALLCDINYVDPTLTLSQVSNDTVVCDSTQLTLTATSDTGLVYWESPRGTVVNSGNTHTALITQNTVFYVYSVLNGIVSDTAEINVGVITCAPVYPGFVISDTSLCEGAELQLVIQSDSGVVHWDSPLGTNVVFGDTFNVVVSQTQQYFLYVQYSTGMSDTSSFTVTMKNCVAGIYPPIAPKDTLICEDEEVIFRAFRDTGMVYWTSSQGVILDSGNTVTFSLTSDSRIYLYNEVNGQRSDTVSFFITVKGCGEEVFPNIFTPNGDGLNDFLYFTIPNATCFKAEIYNRWGVLIYEMNEIEYSWNGVVQHTGEPLPDGVYFYIVSYCVDGAAEKQKRGSITLIR
jgi:gliding motility-associated-like protein